MSLVHFPSLGITKNSLALSQTRTALLIKPAGEANNLSNLTSPDHKEPWKSIPGSALSLIPPAERKGQHRARCHQLIEGQSTLQHICCSQRGNLPDTGSDCSGAKGELRKGFLHCTFLRWKWPHPFFVPTELWPVDEGEFNSFSSMNLSELQFCIKVPMNRLGSSQGDTFSCLHLAPRYHLARLLFCAICSFENKNSNCACNPFAKLIFKTPHFCWWHSSKSSFHFCEKIFCY